MKSLIGLVSPLKSPLFGRLLDEMDPLDEVSAMIRETIEESPGQSARDGDVIREGVDEELDGLRAIAKDSKTILLQIEEEKIRHFTIWWRPRDFKRVCKRPHIAFNGDSLIESQVLFCH